MWFDVGLVGVAVFLTFALGFSACSLRKRAALGCKQRETCPLWVTAAMWAVLCALLFAHRGATEVPVFFVFVVYLMGGVGEVASLMVLRDRSTDAIAALGLRAGIIAIPLVLLLFAGFNI